MSYRIGDDFFSSDGIETTTQANIEIIQQHKKNPNDKYFGTYKFTFEPLTDCHVKINGTQIFLRANRIFSTDHYDPIIKTFVIVESGVQYWYVGAY